MAYFPNNSNGQATSANSAPVVIASDQSSISTSMPDLYTVGQATQTAVVANILTVASGSAATDAMGYKSASVQVVSTGTGGTFIFEGSNDNVNFQTIPVYSQLILTGTPIVAAITATSSQLIYTFPVAVRYVRLRIATTITGGSIQAFSRLGQAAWTAAITEVAQATAANLQTTATIASGTVTTVTSLTTLANGQTAHSAASTGSPVRVAGRVNTTLDTSLVQGDASDMFITTAGQLVEKPFGTAENDWFYANPIASPIITTTAVALKAAGAASIRNYCTGVQVFNTSTTVSSLVTILDGATVIWTGYIPAASATSLQDNSIVVTFLNPLRGTAATAMNFQVNTTAANVYVSAQGYQSF